MSHHCIIMFYVEFVRGNLKIDKNNKFPSYSTQYRIITNDERMKFRSGVSLRTVSLRSKKWCKVIGLFVQYILLSFTPVGTRK